jgi:uncharacterized phage protein gp47/JayE
MTFIPRSITAIAQAIRGDLRRELPGTDAMVWPNTLSVFSKVVAMANHLIEQRMAWVFRQIFASTADRQHLERHAYEFGLARRAAAAATGTILTTGTPGAVYAAGITYISGSQSYRTSSEARASENGDLFLRVHATSAGAATNRDAGTTLTLLDGGLFPSLAASGTVTSAGLGGGADVEADEDLRRRVLDRKRRPPQGGAVSDYEQFALSVPGVMKAWAWSFANGPGTVGVWFLFAGRPNGIPSVADVLAVAEDLEARRMIRVSLSVAAPIPSPVNVTISGLSRDTIETRAAIEASITEMLYDRARPGVAAEAFVLSRSWISEAISQAIGEDRHVLAAPLVDVVFTGGEYPVLGTVDYV